MRVRRRAWLIGLLTVALLPVGATSRPLDRLKAEGAIRFAVYRDFRPWSWRDASGAVVGIDVDIANEVARRLMLRPQIVEFMADESVGDDLRNMVWRGPLIGGSTVDVMMHVPVDRAFAKENDRAVIGAPYYREGFAMACGVDTDCEVAPPQFKGKRLAAELDSIPDFYFASSFGGVLRASVQHTMSGSAAIDAVKGGRADVVLATRAQVEHALADRPATLKLRRGPIPALPSAGWDVGVAVKDDSRDLAEQLDQTIAAMRADGTMARIMAAHGVQHREPLAR